MKAQKHYLNKFQYVFSVKFNLNTVDWLKMKNQLKHYISVPSKKLTLISQKTNKTLLKISFRKLNECF